MVIRLNGRGMRPRWQGWGSAQVNQRDMTATQAYISNVRGDRAFEEPNTAFVCPFESCGAFSNHYWGAVASLNVWDGAHRNSSRPISDVSCIVTACCEACRQESVFVNGKLVFPTKLEAPPPHSDMPIEISTEYAEAASVLTNSPRAAAALLRLAVQKLLPLIGATKNDINAQIQELVQKGLVSAAVQKALDSLRVIGNEAVHPGTLDLKDDAATARTLFSLLNFIVEKSITEPKLVDEIFASLPEAKLEGIKNRDGVPTDPY
jgi:hypothetical protein